MADKLEWMNKHFVLLRHKTVQEAMEKEKYKLRADLAEFVTSTPMAAEEFLYNLQEAGKFKEACDFLSYVLHRRAAVWWGYCCLLTLAEELEINPAVDRNIDDIGAPREAEIPEWAQEPPELSEEEEAVEAEILEKLESLKADFGAQIEKLQALIPPEVQALWDNVYGSVQKEFEKIHGISIDDLITKAAEKSVGPLFTIDPNSPAFQAEEKLRADIEAKRKETIDLVKSVLPPKMPEHQKKLRDNAMQAVYRWIVAPDEGNSQAAMDIGNECPDQPAGLLALAAYWSFGNLMPEGEQIVQTPAGLAANGLNSALLQAALHKGGTRKYLERCELYLDLGLQVIRGENMWDETVSEKTAPHENIVPPPPPAAEPPPPPQNVYKKWNPNQK